jgi:D-alanyl-D-alanine carboxypeptidase/D-alanyl-D-alanine-endopeptidase (penicillin-binding protein 4)
MTRLLFAAAVAGAAHLILCPSAAPQSSGLTRALDRRLDSPPFHRHHWGILVADERGRVLYARDANRFFTPASTAKLVVTAAAALLLPPDFTVRTSVYAGGPVQEGVLRGNLVLYGRGDPTWSRRCYGVDSSVAGSCEAAGSTRRSFTRPGRTTT